MPPARLHERVCARLNDLGVPCPTVEVETVDALERSPGEKLQMIVPQRKSLRRSQR